MCFSAEASFTSAFILGTAAALTFKNIQSPSLRWGALIPLFFGIQQLIEGFVWLDLNKLEISASSLNIFNYIYLAFALVFWAIFIPLSLRIMEPDPLRKKWLNLFILIGIFYNIILLLNFYVLQSDYPKIAVKAMGQSIQYELLSSSILPVRLFYILYYLCTLVPPFISGLKKMWILGIINVIGFFIAQVYYEESFLSVWCFFAACISFFLYLVLLINDRPLTDSLQSSKKSY